jgi:hypothetical protein
VLRGERHVEISTSPLGVGRADAPHFRPRARAAQAIVSAISVSQRLYETIVLESRIKALEVGR